MKLMKTTVKSLSILAISIALMAADRSLAQVGNQKSIEAAKSQVVTQTLSEKDMVIGYLHTRNRIVAILRGPEGSVFTVKNASGKILALKLNEKDFQEKYPTLFNQIKYGLAGNDASLRLNQVRYKER